MRHTGPGYNIKTSSSSSSLGCSGFEMIIIRTDLRFVIRLYVHYNVVYAVFSADFDIIKMIATAAGCAL